MLRDLYRDLRDRRLLPVVIALAVAIVAVPFLLGGGGSDPVSPSAPAVTSEAGAGGADPLSPVVLADVPAFATTASGSTSSRAAILSSSR